MPADPADPLGKPTPAHRPTAPVQDEYLDWTEEDEDRYQLKLRRQEVRRRTRRRQGLSFLVIVVTVLGIGLLGAAINQGVVRWPFDKAATVACPTPESPYADPATVSVTVLNASDRRGLAAQVGDELTSRGYKVVGVGNAEQGDRGFPDSAQIKHGPAGIIAAQALQVQVPGAALVDDGRADATVDLVLGQAYAGLTPADQASAAMAPTPVASPKGCTPVKPSAPASTTPAASTT
jgi:hypothetical protein